MLKQIGLLLSVILVLGQAVIAQMTTEFGREGAKPAAVAAPAVAGVEQASAIFTFNQGQWDEQALYRVDNGDATSWLTADGLYHQFTRQVVSDADSSGAQSLLMQPRQPGQAPPQYECLMVKTVLVNSNPSPVVSGLEAVEYKSHYFMGNDPDRWQTNVPSYRAVIYEDIYPGIDLKYYGYGSQVEYDFIISPSADPSQMRVEYTSAKSIRIDESGDLVIVTDWGEIRERAPYAYQQDGSRSQEVTGEFVLHDANTFGFRLSEDYDRSLPLVIDPVLEYSTYVGGSSDDNVFAIAVDGDGCAHIAGYTLSQDFPVVNPYQPTHPIGAGAVITKLSSEGNSALYSTYLGGAGYDWVYDIALDRNGNLYLAGETNSTDFPTVSAFQSELGENGDAFVAKLSASGDSLIYSTYLGGSEGGGEDIAQGIAIDDHGVAYVAGYTSSSDFPLMNPLQTFAGNYDMFLVQLSNSGNSMVYGTYLGANGNDEGRYVEVDYEGNVYVAGRTTSPDFPLNNSYQTYQGSVDNFVVKINNAGDSLLYSTYLGGTGEDKVAGFAIDRFGNAYTTGWTLSDDYPLSMPLQSVRQDYDAFLTKLSASGDSLVYSTYFGGSAREFAHAIDVDELGNAYVGGSTTSADFPVVDPLQSKVSFTEDAFVAKLSSSGQEVLFSTFLGGSDYDGVFAISVMRGIDIYIAGATRSEDFPLVDSFQTHQGAVDVFVAKIVSPCCLPPTVGDVDQSGGVDITDISVLIDNQFLSFSPLLCEEEADVDFNGAANITDLSILIDNQFLTLTPLPACP